MYYGGEIWIYPHAQLELGMGYMNAGAQIRCKEHITIGDNCAIARNVLIMDFDAHCITYEDGQTNKVTAPISIGNSVWIGAGAIILKGVTIGDNATIGKHAFTSAASVVTVNLGENAYIGEIYSTALFAATDEQRICLLRSADTPILFHRFTE